MTEICMWLEKVLDWVDRCGPPAIPYIGKAPSGRLFRQHMREPPMQYLKRVRINQARYLLDHTDLLVEEIGFDVGFTAPFHFSRVFRSLTNLSPRAWRKRQG